MEKKEIKFLKNNKNNSSNILIKNKIEDYNKDCMVCGKPLVYFKENKDLRCSVCNKVFSSNVTCEDGHYICDNCHSEKGIAQIKYKCLNSEEKNPIKLCDELMHMDSIHMHGPEHHVLVGAALLTAYKNCGGDINLEYALRTMITRGKQIPGGVCGNWGACGAALSQGIFIAIVTGSSPLSKEAWGISNKATGEALLNVAKYGGPRCCKRDSYLSILSAMNTSKNVLGVTMEGPGKIVCDFSKINETCLKEKCPFYNRSQDK